MGCLVRLLALGALLVLVVLAWRSAPELRERVRPGSAVDQEEPSPERAAAAFERIEQLLAGEVDRVVLSGVEAHSLIVHHLAAHLPERVDDPSVEFAGGEVTLAIRVPVSELPPLTGIGRLRGFLPEQVPVELRGVLFTIEEDEAILLVRRISVLGVPVPRRTHASLLAALDPLTGEGIPAGAIRIPLPPGIRSIYIDGEHLVLTGPS